ncbi:MAG: NUDIX hydrolase [Halocynthiibacter sp.]
MISPDPADKTAIRHASTVIMVRDRETAPKILMGQRGAGAAFMPNKFVFPGGAVDHEDADISVSSTVSDHCLARLQDSANPTLAPAIMVAAIREVWEETGLRIATRGAWTGDVPSDWAGFAEGGYIPDAGKLMFVFRAITPPGRPRRFDARFFLINADEMDADLDDFTHACDELSHLQWIPLAEARNFNLPFITEVVLAEVSDAIKTGAAPNEVPFFQNDDEGSYFLRLAGESPL